jgi:hypothetical protein
MDFGPVIKPNSRALGLGLALMLSATATAVAQRATTDADTHYTPEAGDRDLKSVLFNWVWHMGMLRGVDEHELVVSLEYQANGTIQVDGETCTLAEYRASTNYQTPGQRIQYTCTLPSGDERANIEVVSGRYAWDEDIPGAEIMPGEGMATPRPDALDERLIRLWASPQGAPKAALAGAGIPLTVMDRNVGAVLDGGSSTIGSTSVSWEDGRPVVSYAIPGVDGATAEATLDELFMAERVVVTHGRETLEFTYGDYADWNNPLNLIEAYYAGRITEKVDGEVRRELTTEQTETGSVYVVTPVPDSVRAAITPRQPEPAPVLFPSDRKAELSSDAPTPRRADGKPDLSGNWLASGMNWRYGNRRCAPTQLDGCSPQWNQTIDFEFEAPSRFGPNRPLYKPEHWDKVQQLDMWTNRDDPVMTCQPLGIPRNGPPRRIVQNDDDVIFFYGQYADGGGGYGEYRIMPIDGREYDERQLLQTRYMGHTVGHWEGDTLVLESIGFNDFTWLARGGFFHSDEMGVVERFTRQGDEILYEVTVTDPAVLVEPWVMTPRVLRQNPNPDAGLLPERGNCEVYELEDIATQIRH